LQLYNTSIELSLVGEEGNKQLKYCMSLKSNQLDKMNSIGSDEEVEAGWLNN